MAFDITPYIDMKPSEVRKLIREGVIDFPTAGMCRGYAQANLIILPPEYAADFEEFAKLNPFPCPILEIIKGEQPLTYDMGEGGNICSDIPRYRIYEDGVMTGEYTDVSQFWRDDFVSFLIGCSFSFESELLNAGVPVRHIEEGCNVPMYITNIPCEPAGVFSGNTVVSMRPIPYAQVTTAVTATAAMPRVHGAPIHIGDPDYIGINDINKPDFGDPVTIKPGETPVFWCCGVTPQAVLMASKPKFAITHAPGHMLITDVLNVDLKNQ